ncbi:MAG: ATPase [Hyphomonadaceae bacterium BRH_c29]|nr:MAG: ATPase [Hyphomonadaceae bacterium BRH_c29]
MNNFILISGCSGGGKSTLLKALEARGHQVVEESGRRVVEVERARGGTALPWTDMDAFLRRTLSLAMADHDAARRLEGPVFFDRGVVDALVALQHLKGEAPDALAGRYRYAGTIFLAPPWPEIFVTDAARRHELIEAEAEYDRLLTACPVLGYRTVLLPKVPVEARADFLLSTLRDSGPTGQPKR